ncbi:hypothetical protein Tco_0978719 [Tanacetum coccineum]|uniref:Uncharacterized protein n=1 Tax=Tanacetum coccineum TaxID=301880 RepID=A0ABQ5ENX9_9ASTR
MAIEYAVGGRLRKLRLEEAWETIEDLAQYKEEEWNDLIFSEKASPDYINATLEQELGSMKRQVESLMRSEVLLDYEVINDEEKPVLLRTLGTITWMAFGGNTRDLGSFGEETDKTTNSTPKSLEEDCIVPGDGIVNPCDGVRICK